MGLGDFLVVPGVHLLSDTLLMPHTYHNSGDLTAVCLINASDKYVVLVAESAVGHAVEADLHVPVPFLSRAICTLPESAPSTGSACTSQRLVKEVLRGANCGAEIPAG